MITTTTPTTTTKTTTTPTTTPMTTLAPTTTTTPLTTVKTPTTEESVTPPTTVESVTPPSKDLAEMSVLTDVELHQVPYHPDYANHSSYGYKNMESMVISTVISNQISFYILEKYI